MPGRKRNWHSLCSTKPNATPQVKGLFQIEANDARSVPIRHHRGTTVQRANCGYVVARYLMNSDILEQEARAGVFDPRQPTYPLLGLNLRARRDNLVSTIDVLERRSRSTSQAA